MIIRSILTIAVLASLFVGAAAQAQGVGRVGQGTSLTAQIDGLTAQIDGFNGPRQTRDR